jgi:hypothetical protein
VSPRATAATSRAQIRRDVPRHGLGEIGQLLSYQRDGTFCEGYDARIKLERTQTIMQGATHCDFDYTFEKMGRVGERR